MTDILKSYARGIKSTLKNYWPAWMPSERYRLGDFGLLDGYLFNRKGSLTELGISFQATNHRSAGHLKIVSDSEISLGANLKGKAGGRSANLPEADTGMKIKFHSRGAFVVQCSNTSESEIASPKELERKIVEHYEKGRWDYGWVVITHIIKTPVATFLLSQSKGAELGLSAEINLSAGLADLAKPGVTIKANAQRGDIIQILGAQQVTPFFRLGKLKRRLFALPVVAGVSPFGGVSPKPKQEQVEVLSFDILQDE